MLALRQGNFISIVGIIAFPVCREDMRCFHDGMSLSESMEGNLIIVVFNKSNSSTMFFVMPFYINV